MAKVAASGPISFSSIQAIMGGSGPVSMSQYAQLSNSYFARGVPTVPNTNVNVGSFAGQPKVLSSGFMYRTFPGVVYADTPSSFDTATESASGLITNFANLTTATNSVFTAHGGNGTCSADWFGYFYAPNTGSYTFTLGSDDGSYLWIGSTALTGYTTGNCLINNGGSHGIQYVSGSISLTAGTYTALRIVFSDSGGGYDCQFSFSGPSISSTSNFAGYAFFGLGTNSSYPANHARHIKAITNGNVDGQYYMNIKGSTVPIYCLMNSTWNGGGWMMMMKASATGDTFTYNSTYWTDVNTTLNSGDITRTAADAKYSSMNNTLVKDILAVWPDTGYTGGSIASPPDSWTWQMDNFYSSGTRTTIMNGLSEANTRDTPSYSNPTTFPGFSSSIWSKQDGASRHVFGAGTHLGSYPWAKVRWGFWWNNEGDFSSNDVIGGIGIYFAHPSLTASYSAGDAIGCCQSSAGLNRRMRVELYGR